jgi:hypothetical protein
MARHYVRGTEPPYQPEAFPFDRVSAYGLDGVPRRELAIAVAAFGHYVRDGGNVPASDEENAKLIAAEFFPS